MTNEEFQILVLDKLDNLASKLGLLDSKVEALDNKVEVLDSKVEALENKVESMDNRLGYLESKIKSIDEGLASLDIEVKVISKKLDAVVEQTADLTEFKREVKADLEEIKSNSTMLEFFTASNWKDIASLKLTRQ